MDVVIKEKPDWVITNARKRAEKIMDAGKAEYYKFAVDWLKKARAAYLESRKKSDWSKYKESLIQQHVRKRKLMGLFKQAGMEWIVGSRVDERPRVTSKHKERASRELFLSPQESKNYRIDRT